MTDMKGSTSNDTDVLSLHKEWDEALCPICMDHPHNAVLLMCSSYDKGCRSYICDTSYRHSNCLDRYKKPRVDSRTGPSQPTISFPDNSDSLELDLRSLHSHTFEPNFTGSRMRNDLAEARQSYRFDEDNNRISGESSNQVSDGYLESQGTGIVETGDPVPFQERVPFEGIKNLICPLCRGTVLDWKIVKEARQYLDLKERSCSREACSFFGNYRELRRHARRVHPTIRPTDIDPSRQRAWRHLEHQREYGDIITALRSAMPGAIVLGDYVIDNGEGLAGERENGSGEGSGPWWTTFFLFQMMGPPGYQPRGLSRAWTRHRRSSGAFSGRRYLWGENLLGLQDEDNDVDEEEDWDLTSEMEEDAPPIPRRRRRFMRSRPDEDQP